MVGIELETVVHLNRVQLPLVLPDMREPSIVAFLACCISGKLRENSCWPRPSTSFLMYAL